MNKIKELRKTNNLSQQQLADIFGVIQSTVCRWENGKEDPNTETVAKLAKYFNVTIGYLLGQEENLPAVQQIVTVQRREVRFTDNGVYASTASIEEIEKAIYDDLDDIKHSFFQIGYKLSIIAHSEDFRFFGFDNIVEYAENRFGFGKTTTYNLMAVYSLTAKHLEPTKMKEEFLPFSYSQLTEMARCKWAEETMIKKIKPNDSVENIKKFVTIWNQYVPKHSRSPEVNNVQELLAMYEEKPAVKELVEPELVQTEISFNDVSEESNVAVDADEEIEEIEETVYEEQEPVKEQEPEKQPIEEKASEKVVYGIFAGQKLFKEKIFSTPGRIRQAIEMFFSEKSFKVIFDPDNKGGGYRVVPRLLAEEIKEFFLDHWDEIFEDKISL